MKREESEKKSRMISFCAIIAALGTVVMLTGGLVPVFTYCSPIIASVLLISVLEEYGTRESWMVWAVTSALSVLIGIDKEAAFFYLFLGWYPIVKPAFDRIPSLPLRTAAKLLLFILSIAVMYALICFVFLLGEVISSFSAVLWVNLLFFAALALVMLLYDRTLAGLHVFYRRRIRKIIRT